MWWGRGMLKGKGDGRGMLEGKGSGEQWWHSLPFMGGGAEPSSIVVLHWRHALLSCLVVTWLCNGGSNSSARTQLLPVMGYFPLTAIFYLIWHYEHLLDFTNIYEYLFQIMTFSHVADHVLSVATHWYALHGDERESAQNAKQGSSASGKTLNT